MTKEFEFVCTEEDVEVAYTKGFNAGKMHLMSQQVLQKVIQKGNAASIANDLKREKERDMSNRRFEIVIKVVQSTSTHRTYIVGAHDMMSAVETARERAWDELIDVESTTVESASLIDDSSE